MTTFYAGSYHSPFEAPSPVGVIIVDGFSYPFSGWIYPAALPAGAVCVPFIPGTGFGTPSAVVHYQTFTSAFQPGAHTISFDTSTQVQSPWGQFPAITFGAAACADADFDGLCNAVDACPLDAANDGDGDGLCANADNCPLNYNPAQADLNGNGQGDACEGVVCGNGLVQGSEQCDDGNIAGGDGCSAICTVELADQEPNADAGDDQTVAEGQSVSLDGSGSNDPDGDALSYSWTQVAGTSVTLTGANSANPSFTSPTVAIGGETLTFQLAVEANDVSDTDTVDITVANVNNVPVADAGNDQSIAEGAPGALDGSSSYDGDSDALSYVWLQTSGPAVVLNGDNTATPSFTAPFAGSGGANGVVATLVFTLYVSDGYEATPSSDTVSIAITNTNNDPVADGGSDWTINENSAVSLNGNGSSDPDGDALTYEWVQIGGPAVTITGDTTATPNITTPFVNAGGLDLTFQVSVDDGYGGNGFDTVVVHVQNANDPPNAALAQPSVACLWAPDHRLVPVSITGVSDPNANATITITSVTQDEPTNGLGDGDTSVDAVINSNGTVLLRSERSGKGNGRVYHVHFTAADLEGSSDGVVTVCVPHDRKKPAVDGGELFNSTN